MTINLIQGDCLELMKTIPDGSVDAIITDPPYGTTKCKWDTVIDLEAMWAELKRIIKPNGAIVLFGSQPFTSALVMSNPKMFKYSLVWKKTRVGNFAQAPYRFLNQHEDICVFSYGGVAKNSKVIMKYNPQGVKPCNIKKKGKKDSDFRAAKSTQEDYAQKVTGYPRSILEFKSVKDKDIEHPTQKPLALMEYLIKTYTDEGDTVLDFTCGSGSTGVAAKNLGRSFIGIELDEGYFNIASERIHKEHP